MTATDQLADDVLRPLRRQLHIGLMMTTIRRRLKTERDPARRELLCKLMIELNGRLPCRS